MRTLLTSLLSLTLALPAAAQLAPPNAAGLTFGHLHFNVTGLEEHKALWVDHFGGRVVERGGLTVVSIPGTVIALSERAPTGGNRATVMDHLGFKVRDMAAFLAGWRAAGYEVTREFTGTENMPNAYLLGPDGLRLEVQEDTALETMAAAYHIHFYHADYEELMAWYVDLFSLEPRTRGALQHTADAPGMNLSFTSSRSERAPTRRTVLDHIGFELTDIDAFCAELAGKGVSFDVSCREIPRLGIKLAFLTDPSGVYIELTEGFDWR